VGGSEEGRRTWASAAATKIAMSLAPRPASGFARLDVFIYHDQIRQGFDGQQHWMTGRKWSESRPARQRVVWG
jgi:hypothetical protein